MTRINFQIYIEQTKHSTTVKIYIIIYVIMYLVRFKIYECVFWPRREFVVQISRCFGFKSYHVDIKFLSCACSPNLLSPFGKMSTDF